MAVADISKRVGMLKVAVSIGAFVIVVGMGSAFILAVIAYTKGDITLEDFHGLVQNITAG